MKWISDALNLQHIWKALSTGNVFTTLLYYVKLSRVPVDVSFKLDLEHWLWPNNRITHLGQKIKVRFG